MQDKLSMVINRANSGVSVADMEQTIGIPTFGQIRSGGLLMVKSTNEGRPLVEMAPKELKEIALKALESVIGNRLRVTVHKLRAFRPARPRPLHRYAEPV